MKLLPTGHIKAALLTACAAFALSPSASGVPKLAAPDFAYPKSVASDARRSLDSAMKKGDGQLALRSVMDLAIADNMISHDNALRSIRTIDSLAQALPDPYSSLAYLLEAGLYRDIYRSASWTYDSRVLPPDFSNPDPTTWSRALFADRVRRLAILAIEHGKGGADVPLSALQSIIAVTPPAIARDLTLEDFVAYRVISLLTDFSDSNFELPFFAAAENSDTGIIDGLLDSLERLHGPRLDYGLALAVIQKAGRTADEKERMRYLEEMYSRMQSSAASLPILLEIYNSRDREKDTATIYRLLTEADRRFPDALFSPGVKAAIDRLSQPAVTLSCETRTIPGHALPLDITAVNAGECHILVYRLNAEPKRALTLAELPSAGSLWRDMKVTVDSLPVPFRKEISDSVVIDSPGWYAIAASLNADPAQTPGNRDCYPITVLASDLVMTDVTDNATGKGGVYVRSATDGSPVAGAEVRFDDTAYRSTRTSRASTSSDGYAASPYRSARVKATDGGSTATTYLSSYTRQELKEQTAIQILTDLAIYHPGDSVRFAAVAYCKDAGRGHTGHTLPGHSLELTVRDANYEPVDTLPLTTDGLGRAYGAFRLPEEGLLGMWSIASPGEGSAEFQVADYKAPAFRVVMRKEDSASDTALFSGIASTYSGMPVAGTDVAYTVRFEPWWFRYNPLPSASYSSTTQTGPDGKFTVSLPLDHIKATDYRYGIFTITATVTDQAGETVSSDPLRFNIAEGFRLQPSIPDRMEAATDSLTFSVKATDPLGRPAIRRVAYSVTGDTGTTVAQGSFDTPSLTIPAAQLPSGRYRFSFKLEDTADGSLEADSVSSTTIIWRKSDSRPPVETSLWIPQTDITVPAGAAKAEITLGTTRPSHPVLCIISSDKGIIERRWIRPESIGNMTVSLPAPASGDRVWADFSTIDDISASQQRVTLTPASAFRHLDVAVETFRATLNPGRREQWRFRFSTDGRPAAGIAAMAVMSNAALDAFVPFSWNLMMPLDGFYPSVGISQPMRDRRTSRLSYPLTTTHASTGASMSAIWETYGQPLYGDRRIRGKAYAHALRTTAVNAMAADADMAVEEESDMVMDLAAPAMSGRMMKSESKMAIKENAAETAGTDGGMPETAGDLPALRPDEMPLAFFRPDLTADSDGVTTIDFEVPDFNTEWKFQIAAYTPDLLTAGQTLTAVAARPVMVSLQSPRFLMTSDKVTLRATAWNNTDSILTVDCRYEVADPATGAVIVRSGDIPVRLAPSASTVFSIDLECPDYVSALALRAYAMSDIGGDGEQSVIPVLPSSQPVVESAPFYLAPADTLHTISTPRAAHGGRATFQYCDNPAWTALTALQPVTSSAGASLTSRLNAFYADCTGTSLLRKDSGLRRGLGMMLSGEAGDSALVSNLEKNADLKTVSLGNTPWVNSARAETLRMQSLGTLLDDGKSGAAIQALWKSISGLQDAGGGWRWCDGMESSLWISETALSTFGMLMNAGNLPDIKGLHDSCLRTIRYCDEGEVREYESRRSPGRADYIGLLDYLYIRSAFKDAPVSARFANLRGKALEAIEAGWRELGISGKAKAAVVLLRAGRAAKAAPVLESIRQFASQTKTGGMWFDNVSSGYDGIGDLLTTAIVLRAFSEADPADPAVDAMRQWIVLQCQTRQLSQYSATTEVIDALLSTGSRWTDLHRGKARIWIDGVETDPGQTAALTGSVQLDLDMTRAGGNTIRIERPDGAGPAWGGVISQYVAAPDEVSETSTPQLSISKEYYTLSATEKGETARKSDTFAIGDRVRVTLVIDVSRDMEYVALTDMRPACLEPDSQLSGYAATDGIYAYREVRDTRTNLFFARLPKGRHVVSYDCHASQEGTFGAGIATLQCQFAPLQTAHSAGRMITVKPAESR